jgi:hypothetical protein
VYTYTLPIFSARSATFDFLLGRLAQEGAFGRMYVEHLTILCLVNMDSRHSDTRTRGEPTSKTWKVAQRRQSRGMYGLSVPTSHKISRVAGVGLSISKPLTLVTNVARLHRCRSEKDPLGIALFLWPWEYSRCPSSDSFDITRPTVELPLDEILGDCSEAWPMPFYPSVSTTDSQSHRRKLELTTRTRRTNTNLPPFLKPTLPDTASQQEQTMSPAKLSHSSDTPPGPSSS